jgi:tRNA1Val (adenine37-N6)-methyltransferase
MKLIPGEGETLDILGNNRLFLIQPRDGYRFSIDSLLLWGFLSASPGGQWADLGSGCGIIAIALAKFNHVKSVVSVEIQEELAELARRNCRLNHVEETVTVVTGNVRDRELIKRVSSVDYVCANPPYYSPVSGRTNPNSQKALARHELRGTLEDFIACGKALLKRGGGFSLILPVERLTEIFGLLFRARLFPSRLRFVHSRTTLPAVLVLIEARKEKQAPLNVTLPFIIYETEGRYTAEAQALISLAGF